MAIFILPLKCLQVNDLKIKNLTQNNKLYCEYETTNVDHIWLQGEVTRLYKDIDNHKYILELKDNTGTLQITVLKNHFMPEFAEGNYISIICKINITGEIHEAIIAFEVCL